MANGQPYFSPRNRQQDIFGFPFLTKRFRRWRQARLFGRRSVSSAPLCIAFQKAKGARRAFQRGRLQTRKSFRKRVSKKLSCFFRGGLHTLKRTVTINHRVQTSQT